MGKGKERLTFLVVVHKHFTCQMMLYGGTSQYFLPQEFVPYAVSWILGYPKASDVENNKAYSFCLVRMTISIYPLYHFLSANDVPGSITYEIILHRI